MCTSIIPLALKHMCTCRIEKVMNSSFCAGIMARDFVLCVLSYSILVSSQECLKIGRLRGTGASADKRSTTWQYHNFPPMQYYHNIHHMMNTYVKANQHCTSIYNSDRPFDAHITIRRFPVKKCCNGHLAFSKSCLLRKKHLRHFSYVLKLLHKVTI